MLSLRRLEGRRTFGAVKGRPTSRKGTLSKFLLSIGERGRRSSFLRGVTQPHSCGERRTEECGGRRKLGNGFLSIGRRFCTSAFNLAACRTPALYRCLSESVLLSCWVLRRARASASSGTSNAISWSSGEPWVCVAGVFSYLSCRRRVFILFVSSTCFRSRTLKVN